MLLVSGRWAVPSSLHGIEVVDVGPGLAINGAGSSTFAAWIQGHERMTWEYAVQIHPSIVQHVGDGLQLLTGSQAILADGAESFGPWMNMLKNRNAGLNKHACSDVWSSRSLFR